jgi:hypothetical protein
MPHTKPPLAAAILAVLGVVGPVPLIAQVITVGPAGSGSMFSQIQDGIAAAPAGGVVLVAAGAYVDSHTLLIDKPLTLLGAGSASTQYTRVLSSPGIAPLPLRVTGLLPGQQVVVAGLTLRAQIQGGFAATLAIVDNCAGPVALADLAGSGSSTAALIAAGNVLVQDCVGVTLDACDFSANASAAPPPPALRVERSLVHVQQSRLQGAAAPAVLPGTPAYDGAPGVQAIDAIVRIARSEVRGGAGAQTGLLSNPTAATQGGAAIHATNSQVLLRGGAGNQLLGGRGGTAIAGGVPLSGPGGPAVHIDATSLLAPTADVVLLGGLDGNQQTSAPPVLGPGAFSPLPFALASIGVASTLVPRGGTLGLQLGGEAGSLAASFLSLRQVAPYPLPGVLGLAALDPTDLVLLPLGVLDGSGQGSITAALAASPQLVGITAHVQSLAFDPLGLVSVSAPTSFGVR